jgi:hypothetical protein
MWSSELTLVIIHVEINLETWIIKRKKSGSYALNHTKMIPILKKLSKKVNK